MSLVQRVRKTLGILGLVVAAPVLVSAQSGYVTNGVEYAPVGYLPGDQINPALAVSHSGGYLVWQDNITDGSGWGISATRLDGTFSASLAPFQINQQGADDQENPQVALLNAGGAAFVWQGGPQSFQHIYAAFLSSSNTFTARDVPVNTATNFQLTPAIATLANGNVVVVWASRGQDNADGNLGVYGQILTPAGAKSGSEFQINQFTPFNQRTPAVAALPGGGFVVSWISEQERTSETVDSSGTVTGGFNSVDVYARLFDSTGAGGSEFLVNTSTNICANPTVAAASDGTFVIGWCEKDLVVLNNGWDVYERRFTSSGSGGTVQRVNTQRYGDQYDPKIASLGTDYLVAWTSMGQDGSREGVYGQFLHGDGSLSGGEFRVNTTVVNQQEYQAVASDGQGRFLVAWSSFTGGVNSMDLAAQRYATYQAPLFPPGDPVVSALDSYTLSVTWSPLQGLSVSNWNLYVDGSGTPVTTTNIVWQNEGIFNTISSNDYYFNPGTTHTFQLGYVLTDGRTSPLSDVVSGKTWGIDRYGKAPGGNAADGLPDDWETLYWGANRTNWLSPNTVLAPDGTTVEMVFQWGGNPNDPSTWLRTSISHSVQGYYLKWNTVPGCIYQVKHSTDLLNWSNLGSPRYAAGTTDSVYLGLTNKDYFQITRLVY